MATIERTAACGGLRAAKSAGDGSQGGVEFLNAKLTVLGIPQAAWSSSV